MQIIVSTLFLLLIHHSTAIYVGDWETGSPRWRSTRALDQFKSMVRCTTHRHVLKAYNGYGCWCGFGGGGNPVDETDRCCMDHDQCYSEAINKQVCSNTEVYIARYESATDECRSDATSITCKEGSTNHPSHKKCAYEICECDREAALCFKTSSYNSKFLDHDRSACKAE